MKNNITILGTGMSGLLAGKAALEEGLTPIFYDKDYARKNMNMPGLHYMHDNCGMGIDAYVVHNYVQSKGSDPIGEQYCRKVFGALNETAKNNSLTDLPDSNAFYNMKEMYDLLYAKMLPYFSKEYVEVMEDNVHELGDKIISTIPLYYLFPEIECMSSSVYYTNDLKVLEPNDNYVVYNTIEDKNWYRTSHINGRNCTEYVKFFSGCKTMNKIITANIDRDIILKDEGILLLGRYGAWDRKFLAHQAYYNTKKAIRLGLFK